MMFLAQIKWRLLATYILVVAVCIGVVIAITRQLTLTIYNSRHAEMQEMMARGEHPMAPDQNRVALIEEAFRNAVNEALFWGGLIAVMLAVIISLLISRRITRPIHDMAAVTERIAEGDYSRRVDLRSRDEIGSLARSLNRMAERLDESEQTRRELIGNIAHELRTPLTSISGYMEGLADGVVPASGETWELLGREAQRLSRLVDDLQKLSRAEAGQEMFDIVSLPVAPFLERIISKMKPQFGEKGIDLSLEVNDGIPAVLADEDKLEQVLVNLIDNAFRYTEAGGRVLVGADAGRDGVEIRVTDTGIGIDPDDLPYIFERFYRAEKSRSREQGGSGIGLTIAKRYVESLGGTIAARSEGRSGAVFTVVLPAAEK